MARQDSKKRTFHTILRFPERGDKDSKGPLIDYKDVDLLRKFMTSSAKMQSRKRTGTSAQQQKALKLAIKQARYMALLPYTST